MRQVALTIYTLLASNILGPHQALSNHADIKATLPSLSDARVPRELAINTDVKDLAEKLVRQAHIPGLSIGVVHSDNSLEVVNWGIRSEGQERMTTDTLYSIGSCSKAFLSATMGILIDDFAQGRNRTALPYGISTLDWNTKIEDLLPNDWRLMEGWASQKVTIRDALSHRTGIPRHEFSYRATDKPLDVIRRMQHLRPAFELREKWHYTNHMYMLGQHLIATYSGMSYPEYVQERIFNRLGMSSATFSPAKALRSGKRTEAWTQSGRRIPFWISEDDAEVSEGAGGVITSAGDLMKWVRMLVNKGIDPINNNTIIPRSVYDEVTAAHTITASRAPEPYFAVEGYGMGWWRRSYQGHEVVDHSGAIPGFSAQVLVLPSDKVGVVALANVERVHTQELAIIYRVIEDLLKLPRKESERLSSISSTSDPKSSRPSPADLTPAPTHKSPILLSVAKYAGNYYDPGYGMLTFCAPTPTPSTDCTIVLSSFSPFYNVYSNATPELYASISSPWISHIRLVHRSENVFAFHGTFLFPNGYGKDTSPFQVELTDASDDTTARIEFVVEDGKVKGFAMNGFIDETPEMRRGTGENIAETAEVWFQKL